MEPSLNTRGTLQRVTNNIRIASLGAVIAASLLLAAGAEAKAPPGGVDLCGANGDCVNVPVQDAETNWALWSPPSQSDSSRTSAVAPFLLARWQWPDQPMQTAYYVPSTGKTRQTDSTGFLVSWFKLQNAESVRALAASIGAYPIPTVTRVTVGGRPVADPQSYLKLFAVGSPWWSPSWPRWLGVRFTSQAPSPWTDGREDVRIGRTGRLLWVDGSTFRIPLQLARRIRAGRPLGS